MSNEEWVKAVEWATPVAAALGDGWSVRAGHWDSGGDAFMDGPDGQSLHVRTQTSYQLPAGKVALSWSVERELYDHSRYDESTHKNIRLAAGKSPGTATREITRRLLPGLAELVATLSDRKVRSEQREADINTAMYRFAEALGSGAQFHVAGRMSSGATRQRPEVHLGSYANGVKAEGYGDTIEATVRMPIEVMIKVAEAIGKLYTPEPTP